MPSKTYTFNAFVTVESDNESHAGQALVSLDVNAESVCFFPEEAREVAGLLVSASYAAEGKAPAADMAAYLVETGKQEGRVQAFTDLNRAAEDFASAGAYMRAACYYEAAARIAPANCEGRHDSRVSADLMDREAAALLSNNREAIQKEASAAARVDSALNITRAAKDAAAGGLWSKAATLWAAAAMAAPEAAAAGLWGKESRSCKTKADSAQAAALAAFNQSAIAGAIDMGDARAAIVAALAALNQPSYGHDSNALAYAGEARDILLKAAAMAAPAPALGPILGLGRSDLQSLILESASKWAFHDFEADQSGKPSFVLIMEKLGEVAKGIEGQIQAIEKAAALEAIENMLSDCEEVTAGNGANNEGQMYSDVKAGLESAAALIKGMI